MSLLLAATDDPLNHVTDVILLGTPEFPILTMHMVTMIFVALLLIFVMMRVAKAITTGPASQGNERYLTKGRFAQMVEAMVVYLRDQILTPVMGEHDSRKYLPFLMTAFFFVLFNNVFGLIPLLDLQHLFGIHTTWFGGTATGNIMVTAGLATVAFFMIEIHAFRELGVKGWLQHQFGGLVPGPIYLLPVALLVFVIEVMGHFIKPAALAIRLFANMIGGHTLMAVLMSFGLMAIKAGLGAFGWGSVTAISGIAGIAINFLELFVAFLQAFIFMFLTAVFISLLSHHQEEEEHEAAAAREKDIEAAVHAHAH